MNTSMTDREYIAHMESTRHGVPEVMELCRRLENALRNNEKNDKIEAKWDLEHLEHKLGGVRSALADVYNEVEYIKERMEDV